MKLNKYIKDFFYSFPFQLVIVNFKRNQILLLFWLLLFLIITNNFGKNYGLPLLFLVPEYIGTVGFWSYFILGFTFGGYIMAFQISSYIVNGYLFPFIVTSSKPFARFFLNNLFIPIVFIVLYIIFSIDFQANEEFLGFWEISLNILANLLGIIFFIIFSFSYFFPTNKDVYKIIGLSKEKFDKKSLSKPINKLVEKDINWKVDNAPDDNTGVWHVSFYFSKPFKLKPARDFAHYPMEAIQKTLSQNHNNAAFYSFLIVLLVLIIGIFKENTYFIIPAAASLTLFFSLMILIAAAVYSFLKEWTFIFFIAIILIFNFLSKFDILNYHKSAYGLSYNKMEQVDEYKSIKSDKNKQESGEQLKQILLNWDKKNTKKAKKPKMVFINASGGGLKAALWSYYSLAYTDSCLKGELFNHTILMTGASGGMFGTAYFRAKKFACEPNNSDLLSNSIIDSFSQDMLNPTAFTMVVNDFFFRFQKVSFNQRKYYKDRSFALEKSMDKNTGSILNYSLNYYQIPEYESDIPMLILTPSIINNGGKLLISPQNISYLIPEPLENEYINFLQKYKHFQSDSLRFLSALRMNAAFPYITPFVLLPGNDQIRVTDAALHDNYGLSTTLLFLSAFKKWIRENTSGIIIINISDTKRQFEYTEQSLLNDFFKPFESVFSNIFNVQKNNHHFMLNLFKQNFPGKMDILYFNLTEKEEQISLSWHLTKKEKRQIFESINVEKNKQNIERLKILLDD
ncbi:MAG: hypothetical protein ABFS35_13700 [Bacteroidota bacterium]